MTELHWVSLRSSDNFQTADAIASTVHDLRTYALRSPNPLEKGAIDVPPFSRGARGDLGFKLVVRKS